MFAEPTTDDFESWIEWHLNKAAVDAAKSIDAGISKLNAEGRYRSGNTVIYVFDEAYDALDKGINTALGELTRTIRSTKLNKFNLRVITENKLCVFVEELKNLTRHDKLREFAGPKPVDERLSQIDKRFKFALRQYDVGFLDPDEPERPLNMNNHINIGSISDSNLQQGTLNSTQINQSEIDISLTQEALQTFKKNIESSTIPQELLDKISAEISVIRSQLAEPQPSTRILREAGRSLRNITESIIGGAMSQSAMTAASHLWKVLGLNSG